MRHPLWQQEQSQDPQLVCLESLDHCQSDWRNQVNDCHGQWTGLHSVCMMGLRQLCVKVWQSACCLHVCGIVTKQICC